MGIRWLWVGVFAILSESGVTLAQPPAIGGKVPDRPTNVKVQTKFEASQGSCSGEVLQVADGTVTVRSERWNGRVELRQVYPVDLLADGKLVDGVWASYSYRWSDIQKGDTVRLEIVHDTGEKRDYCVGVCITRRPGAKLPESQKPKEDKRYARDRVLNELVNGEDVADDEIAKAFPPDVHPRTKVVEDPGGLPDEYQKKLDAIRSKKKDEVKALPPEKKEK